jgi:hypothetical protein
MEPAPSQQRRQHFPELADSFIGATFPQENNPMSNAGKNRGAKTHGRLSNGTPLPARKFHPGAKFFLFYGTGFASFLFRVKRHHSL